MGFSNCARFIEHDFPDEGVIIETVPGMKLHFFVVPVDCGCFKVHLQCNLFHELLTNHEMTIHGGIDNEDLDLEAFL